MNEPLRKADFRKEQATLLSLVREDITTIKDKIASAPPSGKQRLSEMEDQAQGIAQQLSLVKGVSGLKGFVMGMSSIDPDTLVADTSADIAYDTNHRLFLETMVAQATAAARATVRNLAHEVFDNDIFGSFLRFESEQDKQEFLKRKTERQKEIDQQLKLNTPEGALNASDIMIGQMMDEKDHGAGKSSDFWRYWNELLEKTEKQREALLQAGKRREVEEADRRLKEEIKASLKRQGKSDEEIKTIMASSDDPIEIAKRYVKKDDEESKRMEVRVDSEYTRATVADKNVFKANPTVVAQNDPVPPEKSQETSPGADKGQTVALNGTSLTGLTDIKGIRDKMKTVGLQLASDSDAGTQGVAQKASVTDQVKALGLQMAGGTDATSQVVVQQVSLRDKMQALGLQLTSDSDAAAGHGLGEQGTAGKPQVGGIAV